MPILVLLGILLITNQVAIAQQGERPFIWVKKEKRAAILEKIEKEEWASKIFLELIQKLDSPVQFHQNDPVAFLQQIPFDWQSQQNQQIPPLQQTFHIQDGQQRNLDNATSEEMQGARQLFRLLQLGVESGVAYFLTEDPSYAQLTTDILYHFIEGVLHLELSEWKGRGGWLFPYDGFREVREIGYRIPLMYDFIAPFIEDGGQAFNLVTGSHVKFPQEKAQQVFRNYAHLTVFYGQIDSNHAVLEAPNLVYNALALENEQERMDWLNYFLEENTPWQDALPKLAAHYFEKGAIWPETSQYINETSGLLTRLLLVLNKYNPEWKLAQKYSTILYALPVLDNYRYPNGELVRWGDGKRTGNPLYHTYYEAYLLAQMDSLSMMQEEFEEWIGEVLAEDWYTPSGMEALLWYPSFQPKNGSSKELPRTTSIPHAGIFIQRNLSKSGIPANGLMAFVGGAHMVHGHAEGMNIELYGRGQVLGVDNGRGRYQQDIHENYSRLFAAHNTVIVNGNSQGEGGWVNLGINPVTLVAMEPMPSEAAISQNYSFSITSFVDDKGEHANAVQERTLALVRTSDTTGFYVDIFRSKSEKEAEFHDYLYHNIGDKLEFLSPNLALKPTPNRFKENQYLPWIQNKTYRHPGWHFFEDVMTSSETSQDVYARFSAEQFDNPIYMDVHIMGTPERTYTKVQAPPTWEAPSPYLEKATPTLVIRKKGEAWNQPFAVVYEPFEDGEHNKSIVRAFPIYQGDVLIGVQVDSQVDGKYVSHLILNPPPNTLIEQEDLELIFEGSFAIIAMNAEGEVTEMYVGEGKSLHFRSHSLISAEGLKAAYWKKGD